jgi:hypothetical protein
MPHSGDKELKTEFSPDGLNFLAIQARFRDLETKATIFGE